MRTFVNMLAALCAVMLAACTSPISQVPSTTTAATDPSEPRMSNVMQRGDRWHEAGQVAVPSQLAGWRCKLMSIPVRAKWCVANPGEVPYASNVITFAHVDALYSEGVPVMRAVALGWPTVPTAHESQRARCERASYYGDWKAFRRCYDLEPPYRRSRTVRIIIR